MTERKQSAINEVFGDAAAGRMDFLNARTLAYSVEGEMENLQKLTAEAQERVKASRGEARQRAALLAGVGLWIMNRYPEACEVLANVADEADGAYFLGLCQTETGDYAAAVKSFQRAASAKQDAFVCQMGQVEALRRAGNREEALAKLRAAQKDHDNEAELHFQKGRILEEDTIFDQAMEAYERALELNSQHTGALFRLAYWNDLRGNDELALDYYEQAAAILPIHEGVLINLGLLYEDRGEYPKAAALYQRLLTVNPTHARVRMYAKDAMSSMDMYYDEATERRQHRAATLMRIALSEFELSARSRSALEKMNIRSIGDLARLTEKDVADSKNFGETSLDELRGLLESKGLHFGMGRSDAASGVPGAPDQGGVLTRPVADLELSIRSLKCIHSLGCETMGELAEKTEKDLLACANFGQTSLTEIKRKLATFGLALKPKE